jgi:hypothetical protein
MDTVLTVIDLLAKYAPAFIKAWQDAKPFAAALFSQLEGRQPTVDEMVTLEAQIDNLHARMQQPLDPAQPGDPDYIPPT